MLNAQSANRCLGSGSIKVVQINGSLATMQYSNVDDGSILVGTPMPNSFRTLINSPPNMLRGQKSNDSHRMHINLTVGSEKKNVCLTI